MSGYEPLHLLQLFLLLGYLIRPSIPLLIPILCAWAFIFLRRSSITNTYKLILASLFSLFCILISNKVLIDIKAPDTSKEFGNIYDSWYATHELGKYYLNNQYNEIPGTLWTKILKDYPEINDLKGRELSEKKKIS